jgi:biotin transport system substrate-specific component
MVLWEFKLEQSGYSTIKWVEMRTKGVNMAQNDILAVPRQKYRILVEVLIALAGSCFLVVMSRFSIPLITPVPLTLQTLAVFLLGGILGGRRAAYSVIAYLVQGCFALPVLAGGVSNPLWILGPQAGFLISFVVAAFVIGKMIEKRTGAHLFYYAGLYYAGVLALGQLVIFGLGMAWLSFYVGVSKAFLFGVVPFLSGAALKIIAGSLVMWCYRGRKCAKL